MIRGRAHGRFGRVNGLVSERRGVCDGVRVSVWGGPLGDVERIETSGIVIGTCAAVTPISHTQPNQYNNRAM